MSFIADATCIRRQDAAPLIPMFTLRAPVSVSQEIKKSKFLGHAAPVASEEEARTFLAGHSDLSANHNCWAWRIGQAYRFSDDGEPKGTAGKPMLQAIDGQGLDNVAVVVTRWFGGILLGSGGLMRAYGGTAAACLREGERVEVIALATGTVTCAFSDLALMKARLAALPGTDIVAEDFLDTGARLTVRVPAQTVGALETLVTDISRGKALVDFD